MKLLDELKHMCEILEEELSNVNKKVDKSGGTLSGDDISYIDKLTHSIKSIKTTIAMEEAEEDGYSGRSYPVYGRSYDDGDMRSYNDGRSYAGRRNARRDSMGRYSGRGYSRAEGMVQELRDLMQDAPNDQVRQEMQRLIDKVERMG